MFLRKKPTEYRLPMTRGYVRPRAPKELLQEFFAANRKHMRRRAIVEFKKLLEQGSGWRLS